jgi:hypothetical protein
MLNFSLNGRFILNLSRQKLPKNYLKNHTNYNFLMICHVFLKIINHHNDNPSSIFIWLINKKF